MYDLLTRTISDDLHSRYAAVMYSSQGREMGEALWKETQDELKFASELGVSKFSHR